MQTKTNWSRPISPHLTIYKPQMTSILSILHRITGAFLVVLVLWGSLVLQHGLLNSLATSHTLSSSIGVLCSIEAFYMVCDAILLAFLYHLVNSLRHIGANRYLKFSLNTFATNQIRFSAYGVLLSTAILYFICRMGPLQMQILGSGAQGQPQVPFWLHSIQSANSISTILVLGCVFLLMVWHAQIGMNAIVVDYVHSKFSQRLISSCMKVLHFALAQFIVYSILLQYIHVYA